MFILRLVVVGLVFALLDFLLPLSYQRKHQEIRAMRSQLKKIEDLGAAMEEALILDNKYTEHSTVGLAQQWDQLDQLGMRMQHNLEQQIQARYGLPCMQRAVCLAGGRWTITHHCLSESKPCAVRADESLLCSAEQSSLTPSISQLSSEGWS